MSETQKPCGSHCVGVYSRNLRRFETELLSRKEAAEYLGVTPATLAVWHCTKRYPVPVVKVGRLAKYRKSDLDLFIANRTMGA